MGEAGQAVDCVVSAVKAEGGRRKNLCQIRTSPHSAADALACIRLVSVHLRACSYPAPVSLPLPGACALCP